MWRRLWRAVLPVLLVTLLAGGVFVVSSLGAWQCYRAASNAEAASLLGLVAERYPDLDSAELIRTLTSENANTRVAGAEILRTYGYAETDFARPSALKYSATIIALGLITIFSVGAALMAYLYYRDWRQRRQIRNLVTYVQKLNDHVYDLCIESNSEDDFSLLTNELYKITVTLKEASEYDRKTRHQLETALADISHQLKTPLTSLQIALDNLESDPDMPSVVRQDFLRASSRQVAAMSSLVTTLLNLAKFDNGTIRMQRRVMPVGDLIAQVREKVEILADLQNIQLKVTGDLSAQVKIDPHWQAEALSNIVKNCLEHSPADSAIALTVEDRVPYTRIIIRDHGTGIAPQDLHHIFERFYKAEGSSATSVGIGLSFAKSVIQADQGQISVKSTPSAGTTFTVTYFH